MVATASTEHPIGSIQTQLELKLNETPYTHKQVLKQVLIQVVVLTFPLRWMKDVLALTKGGFSLLSTLL